MNNKYRDAVVKYVEINIQIKKKTREISNHFQKCWLEADRQVPLMQHLDENWKPHIYEAYAQNSYDVVVMLSARCPHCLAAHYAIQERKTMRKSLGQAKAWITKLGKEALKND